MCKVVLVGEGVSPTLAMDPADGVVDVGHVIAGESSSRTVRLTNTSVFPLTFEIKNIGRTFQNYGSVEVFSCTPAEATVPAGETQEVEVTFSPDFARKAAFVAQFLVDIPNQDEEMRLTVRGRAWDRQLYCMPSAAFDELPASDPAMAEWALETPRSLEVSSADIVGQLLSASAAAAAELTGKEPPAAPGGGAGGPESILLKAAYNLRLEFPKPGRGDGAEDVPLEKEVTIGSCESSAGSAGNFEIVFPSDPATAGVFTAEPDKGSVPPGSKTPVKFSFKPPMDKPRSVGTSDNVGQWLQVTARIILKGGSLGHNGVPDTQEVDCVLRGFVPI